MASKPRSLCPFPDGLIVHLACRPAPSANVRGRGASICNPCVAARPAQEFPIDIIEEALDVEIEHPVIVPASPPGHAQSIMCRFLRPISIGVLVELRLQDRLQKSLDDHLGDSVGNRLNSQRPSLSSITFWYVNAAHGWGKVAAGAHPIPDLIKIITQILFKVFDRLSIDPCRPFVGLHLLVRFPHIALRYTKWLGHRDRSSSISRSPSTSLCPRTKPDLGLRREVQASDRRGAAIVDLSLIHI